MDQTAALDQYEAAARQFAQTAATYHRTLKDGGISEPLSYVLVRDWHRLQWSKILWPDTPPTFGVED